MGEEFYCPRGVKTLDDHRRQFLVHRYIRDMGLVCMFVEAAMVYDHVEKDNDKIRRRITNA